MLIPSFELADIHWNFILVYGDNDDRGLSVTQNPHFYLGLPTLVDGVYQGEPVAELIQPHPETIYIYTNNERRIYLEFGEMRRTFDHVWRTNDALSFKGMYLFSPDQRLPTSLQTSLEGSRAKPLSKGLSLALPSSGFA